MPHINIQDLEPLEVVPGCRMRTPYGENLMLSYLEMDEGAVVPLHDHPHEQGGILLEGRVELVRVAAGPLVGLLGVAQAVRDHVLDELPR